MGKSVNKWIGIGNCCADPEVRQMPNGSSVANLTVACNDGYKDKSSGQFVEKTEFVKVCIFGKLAEIAGQYLKKGSKLYIEGKLQTRKWKDQQDQDRYTTEVVVDFGGTMQMLDSRGENQGSNKPANKSAPSVDSGFDDVPF